MGCFKNAIRSLGSGRAKAHNEMKIARRLEDNVIEGNYFGELFLNQDDS